MSSNCSVHSQNQSECGQSEPPDNVSECDCYERRDDTSDCGNSERVDCPSPPLSKIASSADLSSIASFPVHDFNTSISMQELKSLLSEVIKSKEQQLMQACRNFDRRSTNKISKYHLRQVIRMFCFPISAAQFDCLCNEVKMNTGSKVNYGDFFSRLSGSNINRDLKSLPKVPSNISIDEAEVIIKDKIKDNLRDVIRSFWLFDVNKDGLIQKSELRRIIRNYCFHIKDDLFDNLWKTYDPKGTGVISYKDFLMKLGVSADRYSKHMPTVASSLCWKESDPTQNRSAEQKCKRAALENRDAPEVQGKPLEEVIDIFIQKLRRQRPHLETVFKAFAAGKCGEVSLSDFRGVINFFVLAMSTNLFNKVMKKLNIDMSGDCMDYKHFLETFCASDKASPKQKSEDLDVVCAPVVQKIKNRVLNPESRLRSVFTKINSDQEWQVTRPEMKRAIELGLDLKLADDEFKDLMTILDPQNTNVINCAEFIRIFEEQPCGTAFPGKGDLGRSDRKIDYEKYRRLTGHKLCSKLKHHLNKNLDDIEKAILVCDSDQSGFIESKRLREILTTFCFPLTDDQFDEIVREMRHYGTRVNYHEFLCKFKKTPDEDLRKWTKVVNKLVDFKSKCPPEMPPCEAWEMLRDCVRSRKTAMLRDFKSLDVCAVGVACKDDVKNILSKFAFRMTDEQFETLWEMFPRNKYNQLLYDKFLEEYSSREDKKEPSEEKKGPSKQPKEEKINPEPKREPKKRQQENRKTTKEIIFSKAPHLQKLFEKMEPAIVRNFKSIRYHLRRADPSVTDTVDFEALKAILARSGIRLSDEEQFHILEYFDPHLTGKINYREFLRAFVWYA